MLFYIRNDVIYMEEQNYGISITSISREIFTVNSDCVKCFLILYLENSLIFVYFSNNTLW